MKLISFAFKMPW